MALLAPSAFNCSMCAWSRSVTRQLRQQLREVAWGQAQVTDASMLVVVCAKLNSWEQDCRPGLGRRARGGAGYMSGAIDTYYRDKPQVQRDETMRSCGLMAQT